MTGAAFLFMTGCTQFSPTRQEAFHHAAEAGFIRQDFATGPFRLTAFIRKPAVASTVAIYIEGDGAAWLSPWHPPHDPTPDRPLALSLALADPSPAVIYLGRPCQYLDATALAHCDIGWWTTNRFATQVITAYDEAISQLKSNVGATHVQLYGYSGGGVIATLLALRRTDVKQLVTIAAPLALAEWTAWHGVTPLEVSADPILQPGHIPHAVHWVGGRDKVVPSAIVERFVQAKGGRIRTVSEYDHVCCWANDWTQRIGETK